MSPLSQRRGNRTGWRAGFALAVLACLPAACSNDPGVAARLEFTQAHACPESRITLAPVEAVTMAELMLGPDLGIGADIRSDPERLALWKRQNADMLALWSYYKVFHVEGCGQAADYGCRCPNLGESSHVRIRSKSLRTMCSCILPPRPVSEVLRERAR